MSDSDMLQRILAAGQLPIGYRVNLYPKMSVLFDIEVAMDDHKQEFMKKSQFGKLFEFLGQPAWYGAFGLFTFMRLLDVKKENETWVHFAGKPIRFSFREFKIVTGLKCGVGVKTITIKFLSRI